jgi:hypothetical protein
LLQLQPNILRNEDGSMQISIYGKGELSPETYSNNIKRIRVAFPSLQKDFYDILSERIIAKQFTDERFSDAVDYVIDNCKYPCPSIADFMTYDSGYKLYTYAEILKMMDNVGSSVWNDFRPIEIKGISKTLWASVIDIRKYNLKLKTHDKESNESH